MIDPYLNKWGVCDKCPDLVFNIVPTRFSDTSHIYVCLVGGIINRTGRYQRIRGEDYV